MYTIEVAPLCCYEVNQQRQIDNLLENNDLTENISSEDTVQILLTNFQI